MPILSEPTPETFPGIVDVLPDALVVVDATGTLRFANARAEELFDTPRDALVGRPVAELVPGLAVAVSGLLAGPCGDERLELSVLRGADELPVAVWLARLDTGSEQLVAATIRDDSKHPMLHDASVRMRDELVASVSHELLTPLTSIIGYAEVLVDLGGQVDADHAARMLAIIERNAARELRLVEDLLTLAALGATGLTVSTAPTDLDRIAADVLRAQVVAATETGVQLRHTSRGRVMVDGDLMRLEQVVRHVVGNAIKFTPSGGHVTVEVSLEEGYGVLSVVDQGAGIGPEELPRLFEGLYRGSHAVDLHVPGAGLGLPIVKGIVEAHGGRIDVESEHGEGTRVLVRIPLASC